MSNYMITGTSKGLGLCLVKELLKRPDSSVGLIFATTRSAPTPALQKTIDESSGRVVNIIFNPVDIESVKAALPAVENHHGGAGLDVLINNVGWGPFANGIKEMDNLAEVFNVNVMSVQNVSTVFLPLLEKGKLKKVVNITTTVSSFAYQDLFARLPAPAYKVTKAALNMLTLQWGMEYRDKGFTIFGVSPGWLKTDLGGEGANLEPEQGAEATMKVIDMAGKEEIGRMVNIRLEGFEDGPGDRYQGGVVPW
ncbi:short chain dehydrogenase reductase [Apiospora phragmitis]|uniref:Short chain dehydrogenase reductase n=1 Tax=Apiospora phragmitis TaxID=2905665 RepID=A0ABR1VGN3_9PEZI